MDRVMRFGKLICLLVTMLIITSVTAFAAEMGVDWDSRVITAMSLSLDFKTCV